MGMASSQARLLNLTARMHQIEYKAARLEAMKLQMANESTRVYNDYLNALETSKLQLKTLTKNGSVTYVDATYNSLLSAGYQIEFNKSLGIDLNKRKVTTEELALFNSITSSGANVSDNYADYFAARYTGRINETGYNSADGTYEIYTVEQFINNSAGALNYRLMADIDFSTYNPTGQSYLGVYSGIFDGNGHTISNTSAALFGYLNGGKVLNLKIENSNIIASGNCGVLANTGTNVTVSDVIISDGTISSNNGYNSVGCLIGSVSSGNIQNCEVNNITITGDFENVGGFIGKIDIYNNITIDHCNVSGANIQVTNTQYTGGFIGVIVNNNTSDSPTIQNCSSSSTIISNLTSSDLSHVGGFFGGITYPPGRCSGTNIKNINYNSSNSTITHTINIENGSPSDFSTGAFIGLTNYLPDSPGEEQNVFPTNLGYTTISSDSDNMGKNNLATQDIEVVLNENSATINKNHTIDDNDADIKEAKDIFEAIATGKYYTEDSIEAQYMKYSDDPTWLMTILNEGYASIYKQDNTGEYIETSVSTDTELQEIQDTTLLKKAEAKYEADIKAIDLKDRKYDIDLAAIDNERNAIKQEIETLKTVAKDNVERTFKLFS